MNRTLSYPITAREQHTTIRDFLRSKGYSAKSIISLKQQEGAILVNGMPSFVNRRLSEGELLQILIREEVSSEHILPVRLPLHIVYEDEDLLVVNKPADMPIHPSIHNYDNSLANALAWYYEQQGKPFIFRCMNRLDRDTSGLTVIAKHMVSAGILSDMVAGRTLRRTYLAIAEGAVSPSAGTINVPIARKEGSIMERTVDFERGETAVTHYQTLAVCPAPSRKEYRQPLNSCNAQRLLSLVQLQLETGRTHQIRVHMKYLGYPLLGDFLYHPDTSLISRQALHSWKLSFPHPITGQQMDFVAPMPEDMGRLVQHDGI